MMRCLNAQGKLRATNNLNAARLAAIATGREALNGKRPPRPKPPTKKNPHAVALGRKGGKVGGKARAKALTAEERHSIAVKAARARWGMEEAKE